MFPNFLGIGVFRAGTTWLHDLLSSHPDAFVPQRRKELYWFDNNYDRGRDWYLSFFPEEATRGKVAVGEVSPGYFFSAEAAERIRSEPSIERLIVLLRDPANRAFSNYVRRIRLDNFKGSFREFVDGYSPVWMSRYGEHLERYRSLFGEERLLVLLYHDAFADVPGTRSKIASHLGLDPTRFPAGAGERRVNESNLPRHRGAYRLASRLGRAMRKADMNWAPNLIGRKLGVRRWAFGDAPVPKMTAEERLWFIGLVADDIEHVERQLGADLSSWKH